ncbi:hypothetical protein [Pseudomonas sediminis]|uniref:Uncharacterized protein n=1 Tax=Pseudomonas sediminis TaxID=1691904 RepID=A0A2G5FU88_9PSED|nr:hypothetical protein [Pseudomonas sediminis]PIA71559.1 hypothetical protein CDO35_00785 [Pseudomonas sediminis]
MKKLICTILCLIAVTQAKAAEEVAFYVGQAHDEWAFKVTGKGRALAGKSLIYTRLDELQIVNNPKHSKTRHIESVEVAYVYATDNGGWNFKSVNSFRPINRNIRSGEKLIIKNLEAGMEIVNLRASDYWVLVTLWMRKKETVHAHSKIGTFK